MFRSIKMKLLRNLFAATLFLLGIAWIPAAWSRLAADGWYGGDPAIRNRLANGVAYWMDMKLDRDHFATGAKQFDGEWLFGTYFMAAMGYGQCAVAQPDQRVHYLALMETAIDELLTVRVRQFDLERWKNDPIDSLDTDDGHAAYLGYLNLALSFHQLLDHDSRFANLNDRITQALRRRIEASPTLLLESYPYETYPMDNCAVIASVALNSRAHGASHDELADRWAGRCRRKYIDPVSGLMYQAVDGRSGRPYGPPRGSGTTLGVYLLSFMDLHLSRELYTAAERQLAVSICGFGFMREYPIGIAGRSDIDSGAVIFGLGLSPTGFAIGGARIHADEATFRLLYATANAAGMPLQTDDALHFTTGGPLGDAILFAMLTAPRDGIEGIDK